MDLGSEPSGYGHFGVEEALCTPLAFFLVFRVSRLRCEHWLLVSPQLTRVLRSPTSLPPQTMPSISSDRAALCAGCGGKISDRYYLLAVDKQWHMRCLKCCECKLNLESELTCFSKDGSIYCKEDYYR